MRASGILLAFGCVAVSYVTIMVYVGGQNVVARNAVNLAIVIPSLALAALAAICLRYCRWRWLLRRRGFSAPFFFGFLAYLSGFALTASPGKIGELIRIRYFAKFGIPARLVVACFVFERALDVSILLAYATPLGVSAQGHWSIIFFVVVLLCLITIMVRFSGAVLTMAYFAKHAAYPRVARGLRAVGGGFAEMTKFAKPYEVAASLLFGLAAWGLQSLGCVILFYELGIDLPFATAMAIYPAGQLIGAASMLPGGIGTTEAAVVVLLTQLQVPLDVAMTSALVTRLMTFWFVIGLGFLAVALLERTSDGQLATSGTIGASSTATGFGRSPGNH